MLNQKIIGKFFPIVSIALIILSAYHLFIRPHLFQTDGLTVSAAISVSNALEEIQQLYESTHHYPITYNFAASGKLRQQIEQGAPVDIYLSAGSNHMDMLQETNLILPQTRQNLLKNRLALITPKKKNSQAIANFEDLLAPEVKRIAIGEPRAVPAGKYAAELLTNLGIYDSLKSKLIFGNNVRQVLTFVETGNVDAGIVYMTDAQSSTTVNMTKIAPENLHSQIIYPVALVQSSKNINEAETYLRFLLSDSAKIVFKKYGFRLAT